jgi:hypothetical protein
MDGPNFKHASVFPISTVRCLKLTTVNKKMEQESMRIGRKDQINNLRYHGDMVADVVCILTSELKTTDLKDTVLEPMSWKQTNLRS